MISHEWSKNERIEVIKKSADDELIRLVSTYAGSINHELAEVTELTELLRNETYDALHKPIDKTLEPESRYGITNGDVLYSKVNDGGAAVFFGGLGSVTPIIRQKIAATARIDNTLRQIVDISPLTIQAYFNSHDSINRIWPYFDVLKQFPTKMNIPSYNFYYEADAQHNPDRKTRWITPYLDPAGQGWMVSSIAPVYSGNFLEGVVGLDVTLDKIITEILAIHIPWSGFAVLLDADGTLLAVPKAGENLLGLKELTKHHYSEAIRKETFKPDIFNIKKRTDLYDISVALMKDSNSVSHVFLGEHYLLAYSVIQATGWRLVIFVPEDELFKPTNELAAKLTKIGWNLVIALFVFYMLFFSFLYQRAKKLSHTIAEPLFSIKDIAIQLGEGNFKLYRKEIELIEFNEIFDQLSLTAEKLQNAENHMLSATEDANQSSEAKSAFLANMSHEIRTPLNAIIGLAELAQLGDLDKQQSHYLNQIERASQSLMWLVNDILDFSKIEAGKIELDIAEFSLEEMLQELADLFINAISHKKLELLVELGATLPSIVLGDLQRIQQILTNLISNAIKFTEWGEILVKVEVSSQSNDQFIITFSVQDTGVGIPSEAVEKLFNAFTQADASISRKFGGTGLGLAICNQLVELMHGTINVSSQEGVGSTFQFSIPLKETRKSKAACTTAQDKVTRLPILLIDENPQSGKILHNYLEQLGYAVVDATSVAHVIVIVQEDRVGLGNFEFVVVNSKMQISDYMTLNRVFAESKRVSRLPKIIQLVDNYWREECQTTIHASITLSKPVLPSALSNAIRRVYQEDAQPEQQLNQQKLVLGDFASPIKGRCVLLVEDIEINRQITKEFLQRAGLKVMLAHNGAEAVEWVAKRGFDAILMDIQMPIMDGFEASKQIRLMENGYHIPIIAMTAAAMEHDRSACIAAGMNDHISKPIRSRQLITTLLRLIPHTDTNENPLPSVEQEAASEVSLEGFDLSEIMVFLGNDKNQLAHVLTMFKEDYMETFSTISIAIQAADFVSAERQLHQLKGISGNLGASQLHEISEELDMQLKEFRIEASTWNNFGVIFQETMNTISNFLDNADGSSY